MLSGADKRYLAANALQGGRLVNPQQHISTSVGILNHDRRAVDQVEFSPHNHQVGPAKRARGAIVTAPNRFDPREEGYARCNTLMVDEGSLGGGLDHMYGRNLVHVSNGANGTAALAVDQDSALLNHYRQLHSAGLSVGPVSSSPAHFQQIQSVGPMYSESSNASEYSPYEQELLFQSAARSGLRVENLVNNLGFQPSVLGQSPHVMNRAQLGPSNLSVPHSAGTETFVVHQAQPTAGFDRLQQVRESQHYTQQQTGLARFQQAPDRNMKQFPNTVYQLDNRSDPSLEQNLRYFDNGIEVDVTGAPIVISPGPLSSLSSDGTATHSNIGNDVTRTSPPTPALLGSYSSEEASPFARQSNTDAMTPPLAADCSNAQLITFLFERIPEIEQSLRQLFDGLPAESCVHLETVTAVLEVLYRLIHSPEATSRLDSNFRFRCNNCVRAVESLKKELDENAKHPEESKNPSNETKQSWNLFGSKVSEDGEDVLSSNAVNKIDAKCSKPNAGNKVNVKNDESSLMDKQPSPKRRKSSAKRVKTGKQKRKKASSARSKPSKTVKKMNGPHSDLLSELFGTGSDANDENSGSEDDREIAMNAAQMLLSLKR